LDNHRRHTTTTPTTPTREASASYDANDERDFCVDDPFVGARRRRTTRARGGDADDA
jgi:hypothetical protein